MSGHVPSGLSPIGKPLSGEDITAGAPCAPRDFHGKGKPIVYDFVVEAGIVNRRVTFLLRTIEVYPVFPGFKNVFFGWVGGKGRRARWWWE